jgi:hypothetical protein
VGGFYSEKLFSLPLSSASNQDFNFHGIRREPQANLEQTGKEAFELVCGIRQASAGAQEKAATTAALFAKRPGHAENLRLSRPAIPIMPDPTKTSVPGSGVLPRKSCAVPKLLFSVPGIAV